MRIQPWSLVAAVLSLAMLSTAGAQEGEGEAAPRPAAPEQETPSRPPDRQVRDAVEALMGRDEQPEAPARPEAAERERVETATEAQPLAPRAPAEPARRPAPEPRPERVPEAAVPEVPAVPAVPEPVTPPGILDGVLPADEPPAPEPPTVLDDYRAPETETDVSALDAEVADPLEDARARPASSPATTIVVGLIILAVLLVALAAVVGVMAAQRAQSAGPAAPGPELAGWAYLAAPNAPNISLHRTPFIMGSAAACDLRLADPKASPQHARIDHTEDGHILTDLNSANGTFLNGERIASPVSLRPGDEIQMGDIVVSFEVHAE